MEQDFHAKKLVEGRWVPFGHYRSSDSTRRRRDSTRRGRCEHDGSAFRPRPVFQIHDTAVFCGALRPYGWARGRRWRTGMRLMTIAATMAVAAASVLVEAPPANAQSCQQLWVERNSYYKRHGYCFKTPRAIAYFGNGGCRYHNEAAVPRSGAERARIAQIQRLERAYGCD